MIVSFKKKRVNFHWTMIYGIKRARLHAPWRTRTWAPATKSRWSIRRPRLERAWLFSAKSRGVPKTREPAAFEAPLKYPTKHPWCDCTQLHHLHASHNQPPLHPRCRCLSQLRKLNKFQSHFAFQASRPMGGTAQHGARRWLTTHPGWVSQAQGKAWQ